MNKLLSILAAILLTACASIADAGSLVDVTVINRSTGERLPVYRHRGRLYVEGQAGQRYAVELRNRGGGRILTVLSVDGVNAITGETAAAAQSGYVLDAWSRAEIAGWRKDLSDVAAFYFTALPDSYAARTGRPDNVGVIGVAVYTEYVEPPPPVPEAAPAVAAAAPQAAARAADAAGSAQSSLRREKLAEQKLGTGHGERIHAPTRSTEFRRAGSAPAELITVYYDSRTNLIAQGVIPRAPRLPHPFPNGGFVPDPA
jgi:pyruvate/2-oxoglutarate dehydrogenase complex dihydrolipoamide acyltransferase (E2) component